MKFLIENTANEITPNRKPPSAAIIIARIHRGQTYTFARTALFTFDGIVKSVGLTPIGADWFVAGKNKLRVKSPLD